MSTWEGKVAEWMLDPETRVHLPNGLPVRCSRWDGLLIECEHGDHVDYLFPVDVVCSDPPEVLGGMTIPNDQLGHALIYTDGNVALTLYECTYALWHVTRDGAWLCGAHLCDSYRLSVESVDKIIAWSKDHKPSSFHPNCQEAER